LIQLAAPSLRLNAAKQEIRLSTAIHAGTRPANPARRCVLHRTGNYTEFLELRPLDALPGHVELHVLSALRDARDPQEERVRYATVLPLDALRSLHALLSTWPGVREPLEG
jgi:hypothetical protein